MFDMPHLKGITFGKVTTIRSHNLFEIVPFVSSHAFPPMQQFSKCDLHATWNCLKIFLCFILHTMHNTLLGENMITLPFIYAHGSLASYIVIRFFSI